MGVAGSRHPRKPASAPGKGRRSSRAVAVASRADGKAMVFVIPSEPAATRDVQKQVVQRLERCGYEDQNLFAIRLALEEGMMNAIKHGNRNDPEKTVRIEATVTPRRTEIIIEDQGPGFDRTNVPDPCCDENLLKTSGRGILLMEAYMDKVQYTRGGRRVKMTKKNV